MKNIKVENLFNTPLWLCSNAIRMSHDNHYLSDTVDGNIGSKDLALIGRVGNKHKHSSILEMIQMYWEIDRISRGCLQQYSRHRIQSLTVKSSRFTLNKDLKNEKTFISYEPIKDWLIVNGTDGSRRWFDIDRASKYIVLSGDDDIDACSIQALENTRFMITINKSNDIVKYNLCEAYRTKLQTSMNMRAFQNFLQLRLAKDAHFEIRELAQKMLDSLPKEYQKIALGYKDE